jgi:hypothetical protein
MVFSDTTGVTYLLYWNGTAWVQVLRYTAGAWTPLPVLQYVGGVWQQPSIPT